MNRVRADPFGGFDDLRNIEIGGHGRRAVDHHDLICDQMRRPLHMKTQSQSLQIVFKLRLHFFARFTCTKMGCLGHIIQFSLGDSSRAFLLLWTLESVLLLLCAHCEVIEPLHVPRYSDMTVLSEISVVAVHTLRGPSASACSGCPRVWLAFSV